MFLFHFLSLKVDRDTEEKGGSWETTNDNRNEKNNNVKMERSEGEKATESDYRIRPGR